VRQFPLRNWNIFFETKRFGVPSDSSKVRERLETNLQYFLSNYLMCGTIAFIYCGVTRPWFLIWTLIISFVWLYLLAIRVDPEAGVDLRQKGINFRISGHQLYTFLTIVTIIMGSITSDFIMIIFFLFVTLHAFLRKQSIKSKVSTFIDKVQGNDLGTEFKNFAGIATDEGQMLGMEDLPRPSNNTREHSRQVVEQIRTKYSKHFSDN